MKFLILIIQCILFKSLSALNESDTSSVGFDPKSIPYNCGEKETLNRGAASRNRLWPNGIVYYSISSSFNSDQIRTIENGFKMVEDSSRINNNDCIVFKKRTNERNYIKIENGKGCNSYIGMIGGAQTINLEIPGCIHRSVVAHEVLHALGFNHEHERPDRDDYITIFLNNIIRGMESNFYKETNYIDLNSKYDKNSIMHYSSYAFSANPNSPNENERYTILSKSDPRVIEYNYELTETDIEEIRNLYKCSGANEISTSIRSSTRTTNRISTIPNDCQNLAGDALCERYSFYCSWQNVYLGDLLFYNACKKICNKCDKNPNSTTLLKNCFDSSSNCAFWKIFCGYLKNLSSHPCPKTCNVC